MIFGESKPKEVNKLHSLSEQARKGTMDKGAKPETPVWPKSSNVKAGPYQK